MGTSNHDFDRTCLLYNVQGDSEANNTGGEGYQQTWWKGLLQLVGLLRIKDAEGVQVF